jgi:hypothetical protein
MTHALSMMADLWAHVGPGLILAFALPFFLIGLGLVFQTGVQQMRHRLRVQD